MTTHETITGTTPTKAFGYLRVSGRGQVDGDGPARQRAAIEAYAAHHGIEIVQVFFEAGVCGDVETMERPAFMDMMAALLSNGVRTVLIERLDRLSRNLIVQETCVQSFTTQGLTILSADPAETDLMANDPGRVLIRQVFGAIASYDKAMLVAKLRAARVRAKAAGRKMEGQKVYGTRDGESATIARIHALRGEDRSFESIANILNAENVPARHGRWHATTVKRVLVGSGTV